MNPERTAAVTCFDCASRMKASDNVLRCRINGLHVARRMPMAVPNTAKKMPTSSRGLRVVGVRNKEGATDG